MLAFLLFSLGDQWFIGSHSLLHLDVPLPLLARLQQISRATRFPRLLAIAFVVLALESYWPNHIYVSSVLASRLKDGVKMGTRDGDWGGARAYASRC
jgi:hypothetical protein